MGDLSSYTPYDYRRACDLCGDLFNISKMFKKGPYTYCERHSGERISEELDRGNARQRPFRVLPVPNAKPEDQTQPDVFESEESVIFALLDAGVGAGARFLNVVSGSPAALPNAEDVIPTNAWACIHYYSLALATYPKGHVDVWHDKALARMRTSADIIRARQSVTGTRATNSYYGGFLATGSTIYYGENAAVGGLAMLYAYRLLGDLKYLYSARAAANFLRNLQAIGSDGVNFTSSYSAGTARLYTGAITNSVTSAAGFFADQFFYPSSLLALRFWSELLTTDGDQQIGATAAVAGDFSTVPQKLMSTCMAHLRAFWETGTYDVTTLDVRTGLSTSTPAEYFNAYPFSKPNASAVGTGSWEFFDGGPSNGTTVSSINFAKALWALYGIDGLTTQITAIDDWLFTFTSNANFATPANTSAAALQHLTTGTYDPTLGIARDLLVRDAANSYAAIATNGGSLYDWGAFGLMSPIWAVRHGATFKLGRNAANLARRRLSDGLPSDGFWDERGFMRGRQGLSMQTGFIEVVTHGPSGSSSPATNVNQPATDNMVFWYKADAGVTMNASNQVSPWADQGPNKWDVSGVDSFGSPTPPGTWPVYTPNVINGLPGMYYGGTALTTALQKLFAPGAHDLPTPDGSPVTILALCKPTNLAGGLVCTLRLNNFDLEVGPRFHGGSLALLSTQQDLAVYQTPAVDYTNVVLVLAFQYFGVSHSPKAAVYINGVRQSWIFSQEANITAYSGENGYSIGYCSAVFGTGNTTFLGYITEVMCYGGTDPATLAQTTAYLNQRAGLSSSALVYDAMAAAQYATALRQAPRS